MSDGREERAEQEARREWEKTCRSESHDLPHDDERGHEQDGAAERNAS
jgi:hypothetical protein